jgi:hypothetical protein
LRRSKQAGAVRRTAAGLGAPMLRIEPIDELLDEWIAVNANTHVRGLSPIFDSCVKKE